MLEVKGISAGYGKENVLDKISVSFEKGMVTGVIGVNGCGKSTLLRSILGIIPLREGSISVDGQSLSSMKRNDIAKKIAYLTQGKDTPDMTVFQMVLHGRFPYLSYPRRYSKRDREIALAAMERVGIAELCEKPLSSLSGGMRQIAYIAMALAQDTDYILLDEPTTYLDIANQLQLMRIIRNLANEGRGIVAVMHDLPLAFSFCDEIAFVKSGAEIVKNTPEIMCSSPLIEEAFCVKMGNTEKGYYYTV